MEFRWVTLERTAQWSVFLLLGLLPFLFAPVLWILVPQAKMLTIAVLLAIGVTSIAILRIRAGTIRLPLHPILFSGLILLCVYALPTFMSGSLPVSLVGSGADEDSLATLFILYGAFLAFTLLFLEEAKRIPRALFWFMLGASLLIALEIVHFIFPGFTLGGVFLGQTWNAFGSWHEFAILLGATSFIGALLAPIGEHRLWRITCWCASTASLVLLVIANFPDVWLAVAGVVLILLVPSFAKMYTNRNKGFTRFSLSRDGFWIGVIVLALFFSLFGTAVHSILPAPIKVTQVEVRPSWRGTFEIGKDALNKPGTLLFGTGPNTFTQQWGLHRPIEINNTTFWNTNFNAGVASVPTSVVTTGILGMFAWLAFIFFVVALSTRVLFREISVHSTGCAVALTCLYFTVFHVLYVPGTTLSALMFLFVGLLLAHATAQGMIPTRIFSLSFFGRHWKDVAYFASGSVFVLAVLVACFCSVRVLFAEMITNRSAAIYNTTQDAGRALRILDVALFVYGSDGRAHRMAVEIGLVKLKELVAANTTDSVQVRAQLQATLEKTIRHGLFAVSVNGSDYQNWLELATLYQQLAGARIEGAYDQARAAYERAHAENPNSPLPFFNLAQLEFFQNHPDVALQNLSHAVKLKIDFAAAYLLASQIYVSKSDFTDALASALLAVRYAPNDPAAWYNFGIVHYGHKDYTDATMALEHALGLQSNYANALYVLGLTYYELGRTSDAKNTFEQLKALDANQPLVTQALANLAAGKSPAPVHK